MLGSCELEEEDFQRLLLACRIVWWSSRKQMQQQQCNEHGVICPYKWAIAEVW
jgi:hypothetical protein